MPDRALPSRSDVPGGGQRPAPTRLDCLVAGGETTATLQGNGLSLLLHKDSG
jgi:hypothetical protein